MLDGPERPFVPARAWSAPASPPRSPRPCRSGRAGSRAVARATGSIDTERARARRRTTCRRCSLGPAARLRRPQRHPPVQAGGRPAARRALRGRRRPRRRQHRPVPRRPDARPQHRLVGLRRGRSGAALPDAVHDRGRARRRRRGRGRGRLRPAASRAPRTSPCSTATADRADACAVRLAKRFGDDRVAVASDLGRPSPTREGLVNATPVGMHGHPGTAGAGRPAARRPVGRRRRLLPARDRAGRGWRAAAAAGSCRAAAWPCTRRSARSSYFTGRPPDAARMTPRTSRS